MRAVHCKFCNQLLRTNGEWSDHLALRAAGIGCDAQPPPPESASQIAYRLKREEVAKRSWDRKQLEQRNGLGPKETMLTMKLQEWQEKQRKAG